MALTRVPYPSPCYSSRGGAGIRLIVIHTAEGARTIESLGSWFANPANQVSSHARRPTTPRAPSACTCTGRTKRGRRATPTRWR